MPWKPVMLNAAGAGLNGVVGAQALVDVGVVHARVAETQFVEHGGREHVGFGNRQILGSLTLRDAAGRLIHARTETLEIIHRVASR